MTVATQNLLSSQLAGFIQRKRYSYKRNKQAKKDLRRESRQVHRQALRMKLQKMPLGNLKALNFVSDGSFVIVGKLLPRIVIFM